MTYEWWQWGILGVIAILAIVAVRIKVNVNALLKRRDRKKRERVQKECPHVDLEIKDGRIFVKCLIESPPGTWDIRCKKCQKGFQNIDVCNDLCDFYVEDPDRYFTQIKKFVKAYKKL